MTKGKRLRAWLIRKLAGTEWLVLGNARINVIHQYGLYTHSPQPKLICFNCVFERNEQATASVEELKPLMVED